MLTVDVIPVEEAQGQLEKAIALVSLLQAGTDDYASVQGPFKSGFELLALNLSTVFDLLDRTNTELLMVIDKSYKEGRNAEG